MDSIKQYFSSSKDASTGPRLKPGRVTDTKFAKKAKRPVGRPRKVIAHTVTANGSVIDLTPEGAGGSNSTSAGKAASVEPQNEH